VSVVADSGGVNTIPGPPVPPGQDRVLVVDDDATTRRILAAALSRLGYSVAVAEDAYAGLSAVENDRFDAILLDVYMPGLSGLDALPLLRSRWSRADLPVLVISADSDNSRITTALQRGANDYVVKPFEPGVLAARIGTQIAIAREARTAAGFRPTQGAAPPPLVGWCRVCNAAVPEGDACPSCEAPRPPDGWPALSTSSVPLLGTVLNHRYVFDQFIGAGASGEVYRVTDRELGRRLAIKVVDTGPLDELEGQQRMGAVRSEARALAGIRNPHVVTIHDLVRVGRDRVGIVTDYVDGRSVARWLELDDVLGWSDALEIARQTAQALHSVHEANLLHLDVKPANLMVESFARNRIVVRVVDFGLARAVGATYSGGTPAWAAPEQLDGAPLDARADVYGLGTTLWAMLTGSAPWPESERAALAIARLGGLPRLDVELPDDDAWDALRTLLSSMLSVRPDDRPNTMFDVLVELDAIVARCAAAERTREI